MAAFRLSKWYLDCITGSGDIAILYTGTARWGAFRLDYSSAIESSGALIETRHSLRAVQEPERAGDTLRWKSPALDIEGEWGPAGAGLHQTVFASDAGGIEWHCIMPCGAARIGSRRGLGYVERLDMTVAPWSLPVQTLRWGRFTSVTDWIVWIEWRGSPAQTLVWWNGNAAPVCRAGDAGIEFEDGATLSLDRALAVRHGPLGTTALGSIPGLGNSVPGRLLRIVECKWRSRGLLRRPGALPIEGWAIHERVEWPQ